MILETLFVGLLGLIAGSFLCLVAHRLPLMLEREWTAYCATLEQGDAKAQIPSTEATASSLALALPAADAPYNLLSPPSHCVACGQRLSIVENIPLLSWLLQRGRCGACGSPIGWREPLMELGCAVLAILAVWRFGLGWQAALAMLFLWVLLLLSVIDLQRGWLPDEITQPLLWLGLVTNLTYTFASPEDAVIGAVAGYAGLWVVYWGFRLATGREGMGIGDLHLLAAIGAWTGWQLLPGLILLAALLGLVWAGIAIVLLGRQRSEPMPFGPMLSAGGLIALVWPEVLQTLFTPGMAP